MGLDRLMSLEDLMGTLYEARRADSAAKSRDLRALAVLLASTLVELGEALQRVCNARVVERIPDISFWAPLNEKMKKWSHDPDLRAVRNTLGHHLADRGRSALNTGLDELLLRNHEVSLGRGNGDRRHDDMHLLGWNAVTRAQGLEGARLDELLRTTKQGHVEFAEELWTLWLAIITHAGIPVTYDETPLLPEE